MFVKKYGTTVCDPTIVSSLVALKQTGKLADLTFCYDFLNKNFTSQIRYVSDGDYDLP